MVQTIQASYLVEFTRRRPQLHELEEIVYQLSRRGSRVKRYNERRGRIEVQPNREGLAYLYGFGDYFRITEIN